MSKWVSKAPAEGPLQIGNCQNVPFNMSNLKNIRWSDFLCIFLENRFYNETQKRERKLA